MGERQVKQEGSGTGHLKELMRDGWLESRIATIYDEIQRTLERFGITDRVRVDERSLNLAMISYAEDIERIKDFEGIERVNCQKIYAYETFWLLRYKPIQIKGDSRPFPCDSINEKVFSLIMVSNLLSNRGIDAGAPKDALKPFFNLLLYTFKYRVFSQKSLELMCEAFYGGLSYPVDEDK